jgi:hypothetical protein
MSDSGQDEHLDFSAMAVVSLFVVVFFLVLHAAFSRPVQGFHVVEHNGLNCVVAEVYEIADSYLFCSDDIDAIADALKRYRSMPLGKLKRGRARGGE